MIYVFLGVAIILILVGVIISCADCIAYGALIIILVLIVALLRYKGKDKKPKDNKPLTSRERDIFINDVGDAESEVELDKDQTLKIFRKEVQEIIDKIYTGTNNYEKKLKADNFDNSMIIASEFMFAILFSIDVFLFTSLGPSHRNEVIDKVVPDVLKRYINHFISDKTIAFELYEKLESTYNQRLMIYSKCKLIPKDFPSRGTVAFAMSYYMHQHKHKNPLEHEIDILTGIRDIEPSDMGSLPHMPEIMENQFKLIAFLKEYEINKNIDNLKGILV
jgi:hypothetical protein